MGASPGTGGGELGAHTLQPARCADRYRCDSALALPVEPASSLAYRPGRAPSRGHGPM